MRMCGIQVNYNAWRKKCKQQLFVRLSIYHINLHKLLGGTFKIKLKLFYCGLMQLIETLLFA